MNSDKTKIFTLLGGFFLFGLGRWINLVVVHAWAASRALLIAISYGLLAGLLAYFLTDLFLAKGLLQFKLLWLKTIFFFILGISFLNHFLFRGFPGHINEIAGIEAIIVIVFFLIALTIDNKKKQPDNFVFSDEMTLPAKYSRHRPVKTMLETLLRLFPCPEPVALYRVGRPTKKSPVIVTGNYDLTVRRVAAALKPIDCWLLVCNSRGINIWCSSLAGHFKTEDIIKAVKLTGLSKKVSHKKLILPQLCAGNIYPERIKKETKFKAEFGPASINDITVYLKERKNQEIRNVTFTIKERLEMAVGCPLLLFAFLLLVYNFIGLSHLLIVMPVIFVLTIIHAVVFPVRMIKNITGWSLFAGFIAFFILFGVFSAGMGFISLGNCIAIGIGMIYIVKEFSGWSPLIKYNLIPYPKARITVDRDLCTGCYRCIEVCPKGVYEFEDGKSRADKTAECILCKACFRQCPAGAINHSDNPAAQGPESQ
ncbi:MAG: 4Fe-4S binding protein [Candidatus Aminicenantes bacterium]|nr:4Fe-4S binding protein [Candidatus Aminicenantes bacterium]